MVATIALLTDFGLQDTYVGVMKGVIRSIAPDAQIVDLTHAIPPQNVRIGAFHLLTAYRYFPADTIFCAVVDPGVGTARHPIAVVIERDERMRWSFVLPDNGLLTPILQEQAEATIRSVLLDRPEYHLPTVSHTFHGRDIFAPVAAHLAAGVPLNKVGTPLDSATLRRIEWPRPERHEAGWRATILHADHFGNLITNLRAELLRRTDWLIVAGPIQIHGIRRSFGDVHPGEPVAYIGSSGFLELAVRQGNARRQWGIGPGMTIDLVRISTTPGGVDAARDDEGLEQ